MQFAGLHVKLNVLPSFLAWFRRRLPVLLMPWGRVLLMKLACVVLAIVLGGWSRARILPRLRKEAEEDGRSYDAEQRRFDRALALEALAMLAVLSLAAVLGHSAPGPG